MSSEIKLLYLVKLIIDIVGTINLIKNIFYLFMNEAIMILTIMVNPSYIVNGSSALTTNIVEYKDMTKCTNGVTQLKNTYKSAGHLLVDATCVEK